MVCRSRRGAQRHTPSLHPQLSTLHPASSSQRTRRHIDRMRIALVLALGALSQAANAQAGNEWPTWGGDLAATKYSPLTDLNRGNVTQLTKTWEWATGEMPNADLRTRPGNFQATPLMIGDTLYLSTSYNRV